MKKSPTNYAFIDSQNLNMGIKALKWNLDFKKFHKYLEEKYLVKRAYIFIGYMPENQELYTKLQEFGYILIFKPVLQTKDGKVKGNCDAELVLQAMIDYKEYRKAIIVTSDGDFHCLVDHLYKEDKLERVLSPHRRYCSILLKKSAKEKIYYMDNLKKKLSYEKKKHR